MTHLPLAKVKRIARLDPDVNLISSEAETFIKTFGKELHNRAVFSKRKTIQMRDLEECIQTIPWLEFLDGTLTGWSEGGSETVQEEEEVDEVPEIEESEWPNEPPDDTDEVIEIEEDITNDGSKEPDGDDGSPMMTHIEQVEADANQM